MPLASTDDPSVMLRMKLRLLVDIPIIILGTLKLKKWNDECLQDL
jgi:hypothetical protein